MGKIRVKLKRSLIGTTQTQRATIACIGLRKREQVVEVEDNRAMRGQILKVQHLLEVSKI